MERIRSWICIDLVSKYVLTTVTSSSPSKENANITNAADNNTDTADDPPSPPCPSFLTSDFHSRMITIFMWWGNQDALTAVRTALASLPTFIPPTPIEAQSSRTSKQRSKAGKVAPQESLQ
ncbi:hypothetical protein TrRE_jg2771 [Triparma retinervis]|uniref:Uncharacterized protein n=1 Tax=Triparma retinervis TaxID=2557542 RepID=A0A9W7EBJ9_9STRA|nr:hypothetical protein TrRE_jg2771 [Triparma retinervis]